jgi:putative hydrolase of the HAD superfamily
VIETVLFDLDDTLIAEMDWARGGWALVAAWLSPTVGQPATELEAIMAAAFARDRRRVFDQLAATLALDEAVREQCIERYRVEPRALRVLPDAAAALDFAAPRRTGIVTDGAARTQRTKVACAALRSRVGVVVYTDELGPGAGKPSAAGFRAALEALGSEPASAVYVADNAAKDFLGPRRLGMRTIQVARGDGVYDGVPAPAGGEPDVVVSSLEALAETIGGWEAAGSRSKPPPPA